MREEGREEARRREARRREERKGGEGSSALPISSVHSPLVLSHFRLSSKLPSWAINQRDQSQPLPCRLSLGFLNQGVKAIMEQKRGTSDV